MILYEQGSVNWLCSIRAMATQRWSMDFMSDPLANGRRFQVLYIVDDYSRECKGQIVDFSISGLRLSLFLDSCSLLPEEILVDNGPELTSKALFLWSEKTGVRLRFIDPGKPIQNAFVESFNARFRDTCLNEYWFTSLADARQTIESWRQHYNRERPHSSLQYRTPEEVRQEWEEAYGKDGSLGALENSSSLPLSHRPEDDKLSLRDWTEFRGKVSETRPARGIHPNRDGVPAVALMRSSPYVPRCCFS